MCILHITVGCGILCEDEPDKATVWKPSDRVRERHSRGWRTDSQSKLRRAHAASCMLCECWLAATDYIWTVFSDVDRQLWPSRWYIWSPVQTAESRLVRVAGTHHWLWNIGTLDVARTGYDRLRHKSSWMERPINVNITGARYRSPVLMATVCQCRMAKFDPSQIQNPSTDQH